MVEVGNIFAKKLQAVFWIDQLYNIRMCGKIFHFSHFQTCTPNLCGNVLVSYENGFRVSGFLKGL